MRTRATVVAAGLAAVAVALAHAAPSGTAEVLLAKKLIAVRRDYQTTLEQLRGQYQNVGDAEKQRWVEEELRSYHRMQKPAYVLDLDVPGPGLKAEQNIPAANALFKEAMAYKDKGLGSDYYDNQIRAELKLQELIGKYPTSNKISDSAYHLGDIYEGRNYRQYRRSAAYYERCYQWNPTTQYDARLRAARLYDKQLSERSRATELYKQVLSHETDPKRVQEAQRRLAELGGA